MKDHIKATIRRICKLASCALVLLSLATWINCGKDSPTRPESPEPPQPPPTPVATRVEVTPSSATLNSIGQTIQLNARVFDQNSAVMSAATVNWSSSLPGVATVSAQGLVTAVSNGSAQVTAQAGSVSAHVSVTVSQSAARIAIEPSSATLSDIGETVQLTATVHDQNGQPVAGVAVAWQSGDEAVATVSSQGLVTAVASGTAQITARAGSVSASVSVEVMVPNREREALVALYEATNGPNWTNSTNWLTDEPLDSWYGVTTNSEGQVVILHLVDNQLSGSIPSELGSLGNLEYLYLMQSQLNGSIPSELGNLGNLKALYLSETRLSGPIPSELGSLGNLTELNVGDNQLSGSIPTKLGSLANLTELNLAGNQLSGSIPSELGGLANLTELYLAGNQLSGSIPSELGGLATLESLRLSSN